MQVSASGSYHAPCGSPSRYRPRVPLQIFRGSARGPASIRIRGPVQGEAKDVVDPAVSSSKTRTPACTLHLPVGIAVPDLLPRVLTCHSGGHEVARSRVVKRPMAAGAPDAEKSGLATTSQTS